VGYYVPIADLESDPTIPEQTNEQARLMWIRKHAEFADFNDLKTTVEEWDITKALLGVGGGPREAAYRINDFGEEDPEGEDEDEEPILAGFFDEEDSEEGDDE
jgi:hypothetical protein